MNVSAAAQLLKRGEQTEPTPAGPSHGDERVTRRVSLIALMTMGMAIAASVVTLFARPNMGGIKEGTARPHFVFPLTAILLLGLLLATGAKWISSKTKVDPAFEALLMQCLEKKPDDRPPSCAAFGEALARSSSLRHGRSETQAGGGTNTCRSTRAKSERIRMRQR